MFQAIGHFVEKIRRVGYGPLVLDMEPGQFRELAAEEVNALRLTAEGKLKPRRPKLTAMLTKEAGRTAEDGTGARFEKRRERPGEARGGFRGAPTRRPFRAVEERGRPGGDGQARDRGLARGPARGPGRPNFDSRSSEKPRFDQPRADKSRTDRPRIDRPRIDRPAFGPPRGEGQRSETPRYGRPERRSEGGRERFDRTQGERPRFDRSGPRGSDRRGHDGSNRSGQPGRDRSGQSRPGGEQSRIRGEQQAGGAPGQRNLRGEQPRFDTPRIDRPRFDKPRSEPRFDRPRFERPERGGGPESSIQETRPRRDFRARAVLIAAASGQIVLEPAFRHVSAVGDRAAENGSRAKAATGSRRPPRREGAPSFGGAWARWRRKPARRATAPAPSLEVSAVRDSEAIAAVVRRGPTAGHNADNKILIY